MESPHFSDAEMQCKCGCGLNLCAPELFAALEIYRFKADRLIDVRSAYRCAVHNKAEGGAPNSQHLLGRAADIAVRGMTPRQMYALALTVPAFGFGGIGVADHQGYIHVDVRATGMARWCYDRAGKESPWTNAPEARA
jgi:uncharacterized protein YcbK (DUF882 family)